MGLKQSITVMNEFTCKTANGGTRGGTPGDYVVQYMSRGGAAEILTPVRLDDHQNYILNYMARDGAAESVDSVDSLKQDFRDLQGYGGKAFGYGSVSLSEAKLKEASRDIEKNFKQGKTVLKTVLSFDEAYLKEKGLVDPDFEVIHRGDYRGNLDQLKLRMAIMNGLDKMSRHYDDLKYVGVIQVDTYHVHCHLALFDNGKGTIMHDGTQRGKITEAEKRDLRRGIDMYLDEKQAVKMMASSVQYDKQNTIGYIKRFTHKTMENRSLAQFMIACLPEDKTMWRAGSNAKSMQKANEIVREYVDNVLSLPDSGFDSAMKKVTEYAEYRQSREDLTGETYRSLIDNKREQIITDSMNAVYSVLKQIPEDQLKTHTPFMDVMSLSYEDAANMASAMKDEPDSIAEFGFKLRTYKTRLDHHSAEYQKFHDRRIAYEQQNPTNAVLPSLPVYDYFKLEEEYNEKLMVKYQYFLDFIPPDEEYQAELMELIDYGKQITTLQTMLSDTDMRRMSPSTAENYGKRVYDLDNGSWVVTNPNGLLEKVNDMKAHYDIMRDACNTKLNQHGFQLTEDDALVRYKKYKFDDVKALDLHHMIYDFPYDVKIPDDQAQIFITMAETRRKALEDARSYFIASDQTEALTALALPEADVESQWRFASKLKPQDVTLESARTNEIVKKKVAPTIRLDYNFYASQEQEIKKDIQAVVENTISSLQYE